MDSIKTGLVDLEFRLNIQLSIVHFAQRIMGLIWHELCVLTYKQQHKMNIDITHLTTYVPVQGNANFVFPNWIQIGSIKSVIEQQLSTALCSAEDSCDWRNTQNGLICSCGLRDGSNCGGGCSRRFYCYPTWGGNGFFVSAEDLVYCLVRLEGPYLLFYLKSSNRSKLFTTLIDSYLEWWTAGCALYTPGCCAAHTSNSRFYHQVGNSLSYW